MAELPSNDLISDKIMKCATHQNGVVMGKAIAQ